MGMGGEQVPALVCFPKGSVNLSNNNLQTSV